MQVIAPLAEPLVNNNLTPAEVFLLSRLDQPMSLRELVAVSGPGRKRTLQLVYSLALAGVIQRDQWNSVLRDQKPGPPPSSWSLRRRLLSVSNLVRSNGSREFSRASENAQTHYDVLGVNREVSPQSLKTIYYQLARNYHPDRFRKSGSFGDSTRSSVCALKQAYDTLRDDGLRKNYNAKLAARKKTEPLAESEAESARAATGSRYRKNG